MGPKISQLADKNPELWNTFLSDKNLITQLGIKHTELNENYTLNYDHSTISLKALDNLAKYMIENNISFKI